MASAMCTIKLLSQTALLVYTMGLTSHALESLIIDLPHPSFHNLQFFEGSTSDWKPPGFLTIPSSMHVCAIYISLCDLK